MHNLFIESIKKRRSQYALGKNLALTQAQTTELIQAAVKESPSAFNSQSTRVVILHGEHSEAFWGLVKEALRPLVPADNFATTETKVDSFAAGAGTVLFYEDQNVVKGLQEQFALYADNFPVWSEHANAIAQFSVWTALANADIGASLQHYNPVIDAAVAARWDIPSNWTLRAQMPFGSNEGAFSEKTYIADSERFMVFA